MLFIEHKESRIYLKNLDAISLELVDKKNYFRFTSPNEIISFECPNDYAFERVLKFSLSHITPIIVKKLIKSIFIRNQTISIGEIDFKNIGIFKKRKD